MGRLMIELCPHRWHHHTAGITTLPASPRCSPEPEQLEYSPCVQV